MICLLKLLKLLKHSLMYPDADKKNPAAWRGSFA
jgi:hypothetical protein